MAQRVDAWRAKDGTLCEDEEEALRRDAADTLKRIGCFQSPTISAILENIEAIVAATTPLIVYRDSLTKDASERLVSPSTEESL